MPIPAGATQEEVNEFLLASIEIIHCYLSAKDDLYNNYITQFSEVLIDATTLTAASKTRLKTFLANLQTKYKANRRLA